MHQQLGMFRRILVATDFSEGAGAALDRALRLPLTSDARIDVVHVLAGVRAEAEETARWMTHVRERFAFELP
jgi:nucleotide-binding universal stress UspA family protein